MVMQHIGIECCLCYLEVEADSSYSKQHLVVVFYKNIGSHLSVFLFVSNKKVLN